MDSLTSELDNLITLIKTKDNSISSQKELNFIQNKALQEITSNLRNREYVTYFKYLDFFYPLIVKLSGISTINSTSMSLSLLRPF